MSSTFDPVKAVEASIDNPQLLAGNDYIHAQTAFNWFTRLNFQMGPNCNSTCYHCYGDYGPHRKGLPSKDLAKIVTEQLRATGIREVVLTDGEPMRGVNRQVVGLFAQVSSKHPLMIMTNARFARSQQNAARWIQFLKDNNWDLSKNSRIVVSTGEMYGVHWHNYANIGFALRRIYPEAPLEKHLEFYLYLTGDFDKDKQIRSGILHGIYSAFRDHGKPRFRLKDKINPSVDHIYQLCFPGGHTFSIFAKYFDPDGRGRNRASYCDKFFPIKTYEVATMTFMPDRYDGLIVSSVGDVSVGASLSCFARARNYGSVYRESLPEIRDRILHDSAYLAFRLGGVRFMSFLAKEIHPNLTFEGRMKCDLCKRLFDDEETINRIKHNLENKGIVETYHRYLDVAGIPIVPKRPCDEFE